MIFKDIIRRILTSEIYTIKYNFHFQIIHNIRVFEKLVSWDIKFKT